MQDSARRIYCFHSLSFGLSGFVCLADMSSCYDFVMIIIPDDLSADRWLDVSFVLDGLFGIMGHDELGYGYVRAGICVRISGNTLAC